jgi:hypothetical protein
MDEREDDATMKHRTVPHCTTVFNCSAGSNTLESME